MGIDRTGKVFVLGHEESVQGCDAGQPAVDGGRAEAFLGLLADEPVDIPEGDLPWWPVADRSGEETQVTAVISPGMGAWAAPAYPVDETLDFG